MWPGISYSSEHIVLSGLFYHWINAALVCNAMLSQTTWCKIPFAEKFTYMKSGTRSVTSFTQKVLLVLWMRSLYDPHLIPPNTVRVRMLFWGNTWASCNPSLVLCCSKNRSGAASKSLHRVNGIRVADSRITNDCSRSITPWASVRLWVTSRTLTFSPGELLDESRHWKIIIAELLRWFGRYTNRGGPSGEYTPSDRTNVICEWI